MSGAITTIYVNLVTIMLSLGLIALMLKLKMKDRAEKRIFLSLLVLNLIWAILYVLSAYGERRVIPFGKTGMLLLDTLLEIVLTGAALFWFLYVDFRIFHSPDHLRRDMKIFILPFVVVLLLNVVNLFTGFLVWYDDDLVCHETDLYILCDGMRILYFIGSLVYLEWYKRRDRRLAFFSVKSFVIPTLFYVLLYYYTPYATPALGFVIGLTLIYVQNINRLCYQDTETGFYNRLYLSELRSRIEKGAYECNSALIYELAEGDRAKMAELITAQLPQESDTVRFGRDLVVTLAGVKDRSPLKMLADDVETSFEEAGMGVSVSAVLRKKKESPVEFLDRILEKDK